MAISLLATASEIVPAKPPTDQTLYDMKPWSLMYYHAGTVNNPLLDVIIFNGLKKWPETIDSIEFAHTLPEQNILRRFLSPVVGVVEIAGNTVLRRGKSEPTIFEFDPYLAFRWANLPWNQYITTSFAIGEGISYTTSIPAVEMRNKQHNSKRLLNYLMLEATLALPRYPDLQLVFRIHHRSGAFGLYGAGNSGSNDIGLGIRYLF